MNQEQKIKAVEPELEIIESMAEVLPDKRADYGTSWVKTACIKGVLAIEGRPEIIDLGDGREAVVLGEIPQCESQIEEAVDGLFTRLLDKVTRGWQLTRMGREQQVDDESVKDTFLDLAAYSIMLAVEVTRSTVPITRFVSGVRKKVEAVADGGKRVRSNYGKLG